MGGRRQLQAAVVMLLLLQSTQCIIIKHHGFQVQLESVKRMRELEGQQVFSPRLQAKSLLPSVCHNPDLPLDLQPICASQEAAGIFKALKTIADTDECELCENVACTGCG